LGNSFKTTVKVKGEVFKAKGMEIIMNINNDLEGMVKIQNVNNGKSRILNLRHPSHNQTLHFFAKG
jgi:hypothetical protein